MQITNKLNLPTPFVQAVTREYEYQDKRYSVTSILKGVRETLLTRRHNKEITQDVADMAWLIFGTAVHSVLENAQEELHQIKESKIYVELQNSYTLSGQQDLYDEKLKRITDYKTGTVWKVIHNEWDDYKLQGGIYCWMFNKIGLEANNVDITMFLKDWSKTKAKVDLSYPQYPIYTKHFEFTEDDLKDVEEYINGKFDEIIENENVEDDLLPICSPKDRWTSETKYAVMKNGNKRAFKVCDTKEQAQEVLENMGVGYSIEERPGEDKKCMEYCSCCEFCSYYKENYGKVDTPN